MQNIVELRMIMSNVPDVKTVNDYKSVSKSLGIFTPNCKEQFLTKDDVFLTLALAQFALTDSSISTDWFIQNQVELEEIAEKMETTSVIQEDNKGLTRLKQYVELLKYRQSQGHISQEYVNAASVLIRTVLSKATVKSIEVFDLEDELIRMYIPHAALDTKQVTVASEVKLKDTANTVEESEIVNLVFGLIDNFKDCPYYVDLMVTCAVAHDRKSTTPELEAVIYEMGEPEFSSIKKGSVLITTETASILKSALEVTELGIKHLGLDILDMSLNPTKVSKAQKPEEVFAQYLEASYKVMQLMGNTDTDTLLNLVMQLSALEFLQTYKLNDIQVIKFEDIVNSYSGNTALLSKAYKILNSL